MGVRPTQLTENRKNRLAKLFRILTCQMCRSDIHALVCGVRLREEISETPKMLTYGDESGFDPPIEAELGYELWASLRYSMLKQAEPKGDEMPDMASFETEGYGLFISPSCSDELSRKAQKLFNEVYLGCIH